MAVITFVVHVHTENGANDIEGALVHFEPRTSGLEPIPGDKLTGSNGQASFQVNAGRYDIEVYHPDFQDDIHLNKNVSVTNSPDHFYLQAT